MPGVVRELLDHWPPWAWSLPLGLLLAVGVWLGLRLSRAVLARRPLRARRLGAEGERRALKLLERAGFHVRETQVVRVARLRVDGEVREFSLRADAWVEQDGRAWVAEFKGGPQSADPAGRETRRQLLEYAYAFGVQGLLLVDAYSGRIHLVEFEREASQ